jgi:NAD(P)H-hydrate epimerase
MLLSERYNVELYTIEAGPARSKDWKINYDRITSTEGAVVRSVNSIEEIPVINENDLVVDAIFGTGLTRPAEGLFAGVINYINHSGAGVISIDIPSGLFAEDNYGNDRAAIIMADKTLSFQFPKLSFFFPENEQYTGSFEVLPIGLHEGAIEAEETRFYLTDPEWIRSIIKKRKRFDHKGKYGHGLVVAGSCGKAGAAVLTSKAALRTGVGLLTAHVPHPVGDLLLTALPEAMVQCDQSDVLVSEIYNLENYDAIGMGPGIGTKPNTVKALEQLLDSWDRALVLDADAINIISMNRELLGKLPTGTILTPHPGEFARLLGQFDSHFARLMAQSDLAEQTNTVIVLKGAFTSIAMPGGDIWFNPTGNPGMATAGSGDVLTGIILSLLAQGYTSAHAAIAGVYIHGLAGDIASQKKGFESLIASDIIDNIGESFKQIRNN